MILETQRLILRPWSEADAESLYEYAKDPRVGPAAGWPVHTGVENSREVIRAVLSVEGTFAVCPKEDPRPVGSVGIFPSRQKSGDGDPSDLEIGYWIGVPFWGRGLIPEAVNELLRYGFEEKHCERIWCGYFDGNERSRRAQEKCGFVYHHTEENIYWPTTGETKTEHFTCMSRERWEQRFAAEKNESK